MKKVLIVDDSRTILSLLKSEFDEIDEIEAIYASTYKEAMHKFRDNSDIKVALLDINLPDAPNGEVISLANSHNIPAVVLTGTINKKIRETIEKKDILAYILKDSPKSMKLAVKLIQRALRNYDTTVMVVDDSELYRKLLSEFLTRININVITACNGQEALDVLKNSDEHISMVLTDFEMPNMDGMELTIKIREEYDKNQLGIIALSTVEDKNVIDNFLKFGANDFINKPFNKNEVITRINSNLELLDLFTQITDMANKDYMTGAYNRRYFFDSGNAIFAKVKRKKLSLAVAMLDIDNFKKINDTYGHDIGDIAIKEIKKVLDNNLRSSDLVSRFGGEEFCIILEDISLENTEKLFEKIRKSFEDNIIEINETKLRYTVSFGIAYGMLDSLDEMVSLSDQALYVSKKSGRNQVTIKETG